MVSSVQNGALCAMILILVSIFICFIVGVVKDTITNEIVEAENVYQHLPDDEEDNLLSPSTC